MAQNTGTQRAPAQQAPATASAAAAPAVLRQGRSADPVPADDDMAAGQLPVNDPSADLSPDLSHTAEGADDNSRPDSSVARQRQMRLMLRQCDRVLLADYALLAMERWPDNARVSAARQRRDAWLLAVAVTAVMLLAGVMGVLPAWLGGIGFGGFVTTLLLAVPTVRRVFSSNPSHTELMLQRRQMLKDARRHVAHLEGDDGLAWQCARMARYNPVLVSHSFAQLLDASESHTLVPQLTQRKYVRLYLFYLVEADKAYQRLQQAFLDSHQQGLDERRVEDNGNLTA